MNGEKIGRKDPGVNPESSGAPPDIRTFRATRGRSTPRPVVRAPDVRVARCAQDDVKIKFVRRRMSHP